MMSLASCSHLLPLFPANHPARAATSRTAELIHQRCTHHRLSHHWKRTAQPSSGKPRGHYARLIAQTSPAQHAQMLEQLQQPSPPPLPQQQPHLPSSSSTGFTSIAQQSRHPQLLRSLQHPLHPEETDNADPPPQTPPPVRRGRGADGE